MDVSLVLMSSSTCLFLVLHDATAVNGWYYSSSLVGILDHHIRESGTGSQGPTTLGTQDSRLWTGAVKERERKPIKVEHE